MKAKINQDGLLTIIAESDIETYALTQWWDNWEAGSGGAGLKRQAAKKSSFEILIDYDIQEPDPVTASEVARSLQP